MQGERRQQGGHPPLFSRSGIGEVGLRWKSARSETGKTGKNWKASECCCRGTCRQGTCRRRLELRGRRGCTGTARPGQANTEQASRTACGSARACSLLFVAADVCYSRSQQRRLQPKNWPGQPEQDSPAAGCRVAACPGTASRLQRLAALRFAVALGSSSSPAQVQLLPSSKQPCEGGPGTKGGVGESAVRLDANCAAIVQCCARLVPCHSPVVVLVRHLASAAAACSARRAVVLSLVIPSCLFVPRFSPVFVRLAISTVAASSLCSPACPAAARPQRQMSDGIRGRDANKAARILGGQKRNIACSQLRHRRCMSQIHASLRKPPPRLLAQLWTSRAFLSSPWHENCFRILPSFPLSGLCLPSLIH